MFKLIWYESATNFLLSFVFLRFVLSFFEFLFDLIYFLFGFCFYLILFLSFWSPSRFVLCSACSFYFCLLFLFFAFAEVLSIYEWIKGLIEEKFRLTIIVLLAMTETASPFKCFLLPFVSAFFPLNRFGGKFLLASFILIFILVGLCLFGWDSTCTHSA